MCTINLDHMMYRFWDIKCKGQSFLSFWEIRKIKIFWKNEKNSWRYYNFTQEYYHKWKITMYDSWDMDCKRHSFLSFWAIFCPLTLLTAQKSKIFKNKKTPRDIIILHLCTTNDDHMIPEISSATDRIFCNFGLYFVLLPL